MLVAVAFLLCFVIWLTIDFLVLHLNCNFNMSFLQRQNLTIPTCQLVGGDRGQLKTIREGCV